MKTLPIWRDANSLLVETEQIVKHFPRYHKYTLGSELRTQVMLICRLINRAWRDKDKAGYYLEKLIASVDDVKIQLQLGKELKVFRNFAEFERLVVLIMAIGKQAAGWLKAVKAKQ
jgi:hypothetical protein